MGTPPYRRLRRRLRRLAVAPTFTRKRPSLLPQNPNALDCVFAANEHGAYCLPRSSLHRPASRTIRLARVWESATLDLLRSTEPEGDIVHAGTFFGDFLPGLARSRTNGAVIWAFEPNRESYRCAQITTLLNDLDNVVLTNAGLNADGGTAVLETSDRDGLALGGGSHLVKDNSAENQRHTEEVTLVALDEVRKSTRRVAAIQLDVEGHEQEALAGCLNTIQRWRPLLVLETMPDAAWVAANLEALGYEPDGLTDANAVLRPR